MFDKTTPQGDSTHAPVIDAAANAALHRHLYNALAEDPEFSRDFFQQFAPFWEALAIELNIDPHSVKIQTKHEQNRVNYCKQFLYMLGPARTEAGKNPITVGNFITAMINLELQDVAMRTFPAEFRSLRPDLIPGAQNPGYGEDEAGSGSGASTPAPAAGQKVHKPTDIWHPDPKEKYAIAQKLAPAWNAVACGFGIEPDVISSHVTPGCSPLTKSQYLIGMLAAQGVTRQQFSDVLREKYVGMNLYARTFFPECEPKSK